METLALIVLILFSAVTIIALFLIMRLLFPRRLDRIQITAQTQPKRSFWLGLVNTLFASALTLGSLAVGDTFSPFFIISFAISGAFLVGLFMGLSALSQLVGTRLLPAKNAPLQLIWGSTVVILASLTPIIGWFLLFPYLSFRGFGAAILSFFTPKHGSESEE